MALLINMIFMIFVLYMPIYSRYDMLNETNNTHAAMILDAESTKLTLGD